MHLRELVALVVLLAMVAIPTLATAHDLAEGANVRIQSSQLSSGWYEGKVQVTKEGCALVWTPDSRMPGGLVGLGLMFIEGLQRKDGAKWVDVPIAPLMKKEPQVCQEGAG